MDANTWNVLSIMFILSLITIVGFFLTKTAGFGRYTTSACLLIIILFLSAFLCAIDKIEGKVLSNLFFSIIGFAGGLFTAEKGKENENKNGKRNKQQNEK